MVRFLPVGWFRWRKDVDRTPQQSHHVTQFYTLLIPDHLYLAQVTKIILEKRSEGYEPSVLPCWLLSAPRGSCTNSNGRESPRRNLANTICGSHCSTSPTTGAWALSSTATEDRLSGVFHRTPAFSLLSSKNKCVNHWTTSLDKKGNPILDFPSGLLNSSENFCSMCHLGG